MSADNGIYILETRKPPIKEGSSYTNQMKSEYRVAYASAIDNLDASDLYMVVIFGDSLVYDDVEESIKVAKNMAKQFPYLEYGIIVIHDYRNKYFPNMTSKAAEVALDCYVGAKPLDI